MVCGSRDPKRATAINRTPSASAPRKSRARRFSLSFEAQACFLERGERIAESEQGSVKAVSLYAIQSLGVALVVLALKALAYWITGSVALFSDALESIINVAVAGAAYFALRVSETPPDAEHPFGHHKAEYFSAVLEGALIIVAASPYSGKPSSISFEPNELAAPGLGIAVNVVASAINAVWGWHLVRIGRREKSPALDADGRRVLSTQFHPPASLLG